MFNHLMCRPHTVIDLQVGMSLDYSASLRFIEALLPALHLPKSCTEAIMHVPQIVTYTVENEMEQKI